MRPLLLLALFGLAACGNETGVPHPDPLPDLARARSSALFPDLTGEVLVIGLPGCVGGAGEVTIVSLGKTFTTAATGAGSFVLEVTSRAGEQLAIRYRTSEPALKKVATAGIKTQPPPEAIPGVPPLTVLAAGRVRIEGRTHVTGGGIVFATNARTGEVATAVSAAAGAFALELAAASGDTISVYDDDDPIAGSWALVVP